MHVKLTAASSEVGLTTSCCSCNSSAYASMSCTNIGSYYIIVVGEQCVSVVVDVFLCAYMHEEWIIFVMAYIAVYWFLLDKVDNVIKIYMCRLWVSFLHKQPVHFKQTTVNINIAQFWINQINKHSGEYWQLWNVNVDIRSLYSHLLITYTLL